MMTDAIQTEYEALIAKADRVDAEALRRDQLAVELETQIEAELASGAPPSAVCFLRKRAEAERYWAGCARNTRNALLDSAEELKLGRSRGQAPDGACYGGW